MKFNFVFALLLCLAGSGAALAQLRTIPDGAKRGNIRHVQEMIVEIGGKQVRLAPGAQIRDANNRVVLPAALLPGVLVKYVESAAGELARVWILSEEEASKPDKRAE